MDDELVTEVKNALEVLAQQVGQGVDHFWPLFIEQQIINGIFSSIMAIFTMILITFISFMLYTKLKYVSGNNTDLFVISYGILMVFLLVIFLINIYGIKNMLNPEYYAIKAVMEFVK